MPKNHRDTQLIPQPLAGLVKIFNSHGKPETFFLYCLRRRRKGKNETGDREKEYKKKEKKSFLCLCMFSLFLDIEAIIKKTS